MNPNDHPLEFTGEYFVPGKADPRIEDDHLERYKFACQFSAGRRVLDIACGTGYAGPLLLDAGAQSYLGVDLSSETVNYARDSFSRRGARYMQGDIRYFSDEGEFDLITCFETIEHLSDYTAALRNLRQLLMPGGLLLISSPNRPISSPNAATVFDKPDNRFHTQEFTIAELIQELEKSGFSTDEAIVYGQRQRSRLIRGLGQVLPAASRKLQRVADRHASPIPSPMKRLSEPRYFVIAVSVQCNN